MAVPRLELRIPSKISSVGSEPGMLFDERVFRADPGEAGFEKQFLNVRSIGQSFGKASRRAKTVGRNAEPAFNAAVAKPMFSPMTSAQVLPAISHGDR